MIIQSFGLIVATCFANFAQLNLGDFWGVIYYYITVLCFYEVDQIVWDAISKETA